MLSKKSFRGTNRNFLKPLMRFVCRDVRESYLRKTTTDLRISTTKHRSGGLVRNSPFARFSASFDFRLFRQHRPFSEVPYRPTWIRNAHHRGSHSIALRDEELDVWMRALPGVIKENASASNA